VSNRRKSYILTETAASDFREARRWSVARWGKKRTRSYFQQLHDDADYIATHQPAIAAREDLLGNTDLGVYPVGEHYLVYVPMNDTQIVIVALIRQTRDVPAILKANNFQIHRRLTAALKIMRARR
jgi:plasmid stabilization system protein ParE